ncbi:MAG: hypothetical protein P8Z39_07010, partial [Gammaproteobacteria bacterium]
TTAELYVEYTYDNNGNTISRTIYKSNDEIEIISFEYDGMNRLLQTTRSLYPGDLEAEPLSTEVTTYYYDNAGNRFIKQDDFAAHEVRVCIHDGRTLDDPRRPKNYTPQQYLRSQEEMAELFSDLPEALANSVEIAKRCSLELTLGKNYLPD